MEKTNLVKISELWDTDYDDIFKFQFKKANTPVDMVVDMFIKELKHLALTVGQSGRFAVKITYPNGNETHCAIFVFYMINAEYYWEMHEDNKKEKKLYGESEDTYTDEEMAQICYDTLELMSPVVVTFYDKDLSYPYHV